MAGGIMKLKNIFFILYSITLLYCYNVFAFEEGSTTSLELSNNDKILIVILIILAVSLIKGFKIKKDIQE